MICSPLESFAVYKIIGIHSPIFGFDYSITNNSYYIIAGTVVLGIFMLSYLIDSLVPSNASIINELIYASTLNMSRANLGNQTMLPIILALFGTILMTNLVSNIPYTYAVASSIAFSLGLSLIIFIAVTAIAIYNKRTTWLATFVPAGTPLILLPMLIIIELVSYLARAVSLGIRLFANLVAGHTLLNIISSMSNKILFSGLLGIVLVMIPAGLLVLLIGLELAVALIQAYVFVILTSIYINEANTSLV